MADKLSSSTSWADESEDLEPVVRAPQGNAWAKGNPLGVPQAKPDQKGAWATEEFPLPGSNAKPAARPAEQSRRPPPMMDRRDDSGSAPRRDEHSDARRDDNFTQRRQEGAYRQDRQEGYRQERQEGGYSGRRDGGFESRQDGGFQRQDGGFQRQEGGFQRQEGGFQRQEGGFQRERGFDQRRDEGFNGRREEGFNQRKEMGFDQRREEGTVEFRRGEEMITRSEEHGRRKPDVVRDPLPLPSEPPFTAFVGNLSFDAREVDIQEFFAPLSKVSTVRILVHPHTGQPKGFGYVEFEDLESLKAALERNGESLLNRILKIDVAESPSSKKPFNTWNGARGGSRPFEVDRPDVPEPDSESRQRERRKFDLKPVAGELTQEEIHHRSPAYQEAKSNPFGEATPRDEEEIAKKKEEQKKQAEAEKESKKQSHPETESHPKVKPAPTKPDTSKTFDKPFRRGEAREKRDDRRDDRREDRRDRRTSHDRNGSDNFRAAPQAKAQHAKEKEDRPRREPKKADVVIAKQLNVVSQNPFDLLQSEE